jgi:hypothetical protein
MAAAFMVSYVRAKSESLGFTAGTGMAAVGLAPREVRILILTLGLLLAGIAGGIVRVDGVFPYVTDWWAGGRGPLAASLGLIAILATITTVQRIVHAIRQPTQD